MLESLRSEQPANCRFTRIRLLSNPRENRVAFMGRADNLLTLAANVNRISQKSLLATPGKLSLSDLPPLSEF